MTTIVDFSHEIFLEIFDYLWANDVIHAFSTIFPQLISARLVRLRVRLTSQTDQHRFLQTIFPSIDSHQIVSLSLITLNTSLPIENFLALESFTLECGSSAENFNDSFRDFFLRLSRLPRLRCLSLELMRKDTSIVQQLLLLIFENFTLTTFRLRTWALGTFVIPPLVPSTSIEYLTLRGLQSSVNIFDFLRATVNVRKVRLIGLETVPMSAEPLVLRQVQQLTLDTCPLTWLDRLFEFIDRSFVQLRNLKIQGQYNGNDAVPLMNIVYWNSWYNFQLRRKHLQIIQIDLQLNMPLEWSNTLPFERLEFDSEHQLSFVMERAKTLRLRGYFHQSK